MIHINILVEGQTEETFVKELLYNYLFNRGISIKPVIISTKRIKEGGKFKGGLSNSNFESFINDLKRLIRSTPQGHVSTFIDFYRLPSRFPSYEERKIKNTQIEKVEFLEQKLFEFLDSPRNFIPYIQLHEFEAFLFTDKIGFESYISPKEANLNNLLRIIEDYKNPEEINENPTTAPSKRILANYASYEKVIEGNMMLLEIGIERIIEKCPHFKNYINRLINLVDVSD